MKILPAEKYGTIKSFFEKIRYNLLIDSILNNNTIGKILVDNIERPNFSLIWTYTDSLIIGGNITDTGDLYNSYKKEFFPVFHKWNIPYLIVYYDVNNKELRKKIITSFNENEFTDLDRVYFHFKKAKYNSDIKKFNDIQLLKIDKDILSRNDTKGYEEVNGWIHSFWKTEEDFIKYGSGYCIIKDKTFISWCITVYYNDKERELGLYTNKNYRNKGYGSLVASSAINDLLTRGLNPHWHCRVENKPSVKLAEKIGFENPHYYKTLKMIF